MAPPLKRVVPWMNRQEWVDVYRAIFSKNIEEQKQAIDTVSVWKSRCSENLSVGIDLTRMLVSLQLKDIENQNLKFLDDFQMKFFYGMSVTRFVNNVLEINQNTESLIPLNKLAKWLGMPQWIVDLRHESTHKNMPPLKILRDAVDDALIFLKNKYWDQQARYCYSSKQDEESSDKVNPEGEICSLLGQYFKSVELIKHKDKLSPNVKSILRELEFYAQADSNIFLECLVENKLVSPLSNSGVPDDTLAIPKESMKSWEPILNDLSNYHLMEAFLEKLLSKLTEDGTQSDRCILAWVSLICNESDLYTGHWQLKRGNTNKNNFNRKKLLDIALQNPNKFTALFVSKFCSYSAELNTIQQSLLDLLSLYSVDGLHEVNMKDKDTFVKKHHRSSKCSCSGDCNANRKRKQSISPCNVKKKFLIAGEIDWRKFPLGVHPRDQTTVVVSQAAPSSLLNENLNVTNMEKS